jgi:carbonic anhydrase/acetyltransferase-like protein (isoleucine patch superfamily)
MRKFRRALTVIFEVLAHVRLRFTLINLICGVLPSFTASTIRTRLYRLTGMKIGDKVSFLAKVSVTGSGSNPCARLSIGEGSIISAVQFNLEGPITIGKYVTVNHFVRIYTAKHEIGDSWRRFSPAFEILPVHIGDGCWIAAGAIILPGVVVGEGSVVSAGSVVSRDVPPNSLVSGNPAKAVKSLTEDSD